MYYTLDSDRDCQIYLNVNFHLWGRLWFTCVCGGGDADLDE